MTKIEQALIQLFEVHRIVLWYDDKQELQAEFEAVALPGIEKIIIQNNQFSLKYHILRQQPAQKFLLYHAGPAPADLDNWLLDVQLAYGEFHADQISLWLSELGLGLEFSDVVAPHADFFKATYRREALKSLLRPDDTRRQIQLKMLAVCTGADPHLDNILENLLAELASGKTEKLQLVQRCTLDRYLWEQVERTYGYTSPTPGLKDFALSLFKGCYAMGVGEPATLSNDALVFLKRWKDSVRHQAAFETLSAVCADDLRIEQDLTSRDYRPLLEADLFELIDRKILSDLAREVTNRTISAEETEQQVRQRRQSHWFGRYQHPYEALQAAARFFQTLDKTDLTVRSFGDGILQYGRIWHQIDQLYRQFIYHLRQSGQATLLADLLEQVENRYTNHYLLPLNNQWQEMVDTCQQWESPSVLLQRHFYEQRVQPFLDNHKKVFVVISDALRYEIGEELLRRIRQEDRYEAELKPALTLLPSITSLGMAALLPNRSMVLGNDTSVLVDAQPSQGTENRKKILAHHLPGRTTALKADEFLAMNREESRTLFRNHEVVYLYHNRIDATGDKRETEERVFEAAEETLIELVQIIKKLANANVSNMILTADHGFLYQHRPLEESDFLSDEPMGEIVTRNRRFVLGSGLTASSGFKLFSPIQMGIHGAGDILIPKSINRLRVKGAGSRYVHGGATLQEIVIPIIQINKKRQSDVTQVEVEILRGATSTITAGQLTVAFYQMEAVTDKVQGRILRAGIYTQAGELISDPHELSFGLTAENPRNREIKVQFILTKKADKANGQEVILRLDEQVADTSHYREYKAVRYVLRRSFTSDFDI